MTQPDAPLGRELSRRTTLKAGAIGIAGAAVAPRVAPAQTPAATPEPSRQQQEPGRNMDNGGMLTDVPGFLVGNAMLEAALTGCQRLTAVLGEQLLGAFLAVRRSDAAWAADRSLDDVVAAHRWRY